MRVHRVLLSTLVLFATVTNASPRMTFRQRLATRAVIRQLSPSMSARERGTFLEFETKSFGPMDDEERNELLNKTARLVVDTTQEVLDHLRAERVDSARKSLRNLSRLLVRAARINATSNKSVFNSLKDYFFYPASAWGVPIGLGNLALAGSDLHSNVLAAVGGLGFFSSLAFSIFVLPDIEDKPWFRIPGNETAAALFSGNDRLAYFWTQVGREMESRIGSRIEDIDSLANLQRLIEGELKGLSFHQACASALLLESRVISEPSA